MKDSTLVKYKDSLNLTPYDVPLLEEILSNGVAYIDSESFEDKDFCSKLLEYKGPKVSTAWFFNYLNNLDGIKVDNCTNKVQLSAKEEKLLFLRFNYLKKKLDSLAKLNLPDTYQEMVSLYYASEAVKEQIVGSNLAYVVKLANENTFINIDFSEAISEGSLGLNKAVEKFDVDRGNKFSTYLFASIRSALIKLDRANMKHAANTVEYDSTLHEGAGSNTVESENNELIRLISDLVNSNSSPLTADQKFVLNKKFNDGLTLEEIGKLMTPVKTKGQVFYVEKVAKEKLRKALDELM